MRRPRPLRSALVAGTLVLAACGAGSDEPAAESTVTDVTEAPDRTTPDEATVDTEPDTVPDTRDDSGSDTVPDTASDTGPEVAAEIDRASLPPIFQLAGPTIDGDEIDLANYVDQPLLLWFWAPF